MVANLPVPSINGRALTPRHLEDANIFALIDALRPGDELMIPDRWLMVVSREHLQEVKTYIEARPQWEMSYNVYWMGWAIRVPRLPPACQ